jgi:hypothetical protein
MRISRQRLKNSLPSGTSIHSQLFGDIQPADFLFGPNRMLIRLRILNLPVFYHRTGSLTPMLFFDSQFFSI